jgi:hypothetical protein
MVSFPFHIIKHFKNLKQDKSFGTDLEESMNISKLAQIRPHKTTTKRKFCVCQKSAHTKIHKTATKTTITQRHAQIWRQGYCIFMDASFDSSDGQC